jgi:hypothetical protein
MDSSFLLAFFLLLLLLLLLQISKNPTTQRD